MNKSKSIKNILLWIIIIAQLMYCNKKIDSSLDESITSKGYTENWHGFLDAIRKGDEDVIRVFIQKGYGPYWYSFGWHLLHKKIITETISNGRCNILTTLVNEGLSNSTIKNTDYYDIPLITISAQNGYLDCVKILIRAGADPNISSNSTGEYLPFTPLYEAATGGKPWIEEESRVEIVRILLNAGAKSNVIHPIQKDNPLHIPSLYGRTKIVKLLLENGADPNRKDKYDFTPLSKAKASKSEKKYDVIQLLLEYGAISDHISSKQYSSKLKAVIVKDKKKSYNH
ncbi:hypothetical protein EHQ46_15885 [Leptospira yanagawae]|uniref:Ankyrin repeat domain-containing protein n=1 Tax=Leptospira yanagawae TaxID=293069 RepID=A0ABY2M1H5_9LEPT|nr:ankyrin repeat domain-containing protein [Leptospira yanagawae]TGL17935.1 hypothetical protein EHQ46_15885 [Leptospira yanagawae]